ncbi:hypothetical protein [Micromonospora chalcea]|uniref:hypothetical protein n=1 Tax=Micromonospora chalcea TaxID=1874 RepID=UPI0016571A29|nr:hypothetical protein [Micromonospora chalcea]MBC8988933.1 hypothetical protein [Micromonospora chalcea]
MVVTLWKHGRQREVRFWNSWHRFTILAMAALATRAIGTADSHDPANDLAKKP